MASILWGEPSGPPDEDIVLGGCVTPGGQLLDAAGSSAQGNDLQTVHLWGARATHQCRVCGWQVMRERVEADGWINDETELLGRLGMGNWEQLKDWLEEEDLRLQILTGDDHTSGDPGLTIVMPSGWMSDTLTWPFTFGHFASSLVFVWENGAIGHDERTQYWSARGLH